MKFNLNLILSALSLLFPFISLEGCFGRRCLNLESNKNSRSNTSAHYRFSPVVVVVSKGDIASTLKKHCYYAALNFNSLVKWTNQSDNCSRELLLAVVAVLCQEKEGVVLPCEMAILATATATAA